MTVAVFGRDRKLFPAYPAGMGLDSAEIHYVGYSECRAGDDVYCNTDCIVYYKVFYK